MAICERDSCDDTGGADRRLVTFYDRRGKGAVAMASRTNVGKKSKGKPSSGEINASPGPTPAEQRKLVDEFLASPRSQIRDPWRPLSERDQLLYRLGESPATAEKTRISEQIEALDAADARTKLQPRRLDYRDQPYTSVTRDRTGNMQ